MIQVKAYSGHIRNWEALCEELGIESNLSREERERQILISAYCKWGQDMAAHLHGMFAFALYDEENDTLFCLRDQFGTKPFYYYVTTEGQLLYGNSIRSIMEGKGFVKELNEELLQIFLSLTYVAGEDTFFKGVKKLMPGRFLVWKNGELSITRYFKPEFHPDLSKTREEWAQEIHDTVKQIFTELEADGEKVHSFLSSGVDSSYMLAMSNAQMSNSCGYEEPRFDESWLAKETADILKRGHSRCVITPEEYFAIVPWVMYHMEQPLADASAIAFAIGCKAVAAQNGICYSGEGSDEFFAGYNMHRNAERYGENLKTFYVGNTNIMKEEEKKQLLKNYKEGVLPINLTEEIYRDTEGWDPLSMMLNVDIQIWLEGDIYFNVDKMGTASGLEIRMPFTDTRIFDIASRVPSALKIDEEQNKIPLRMAAAKVLPEEIAFRKKQGFLVPIRVWLADERYNEDVRIKLKSDMAAQFFHLDELDAIYQEYVGGNSDNWRKIWTIYVFLVWYEEYFVKR